MKIIYSKKIFIQVKNGLSPRATIWGHLQKTHCFVVFSFEIRQYIWYSWLILKIYVMSCSEIHRRFTMMKQDHYSLRQVKLHQSPYILFFARQKQQIRALRCVVAKYSFHQKETKDPLFEACWGKIFFYTRQKPQIHACCGEIFFFRVKETEDPLFEACCGKIFFCARQKQQIHACCGEKKFSHERNRRSSL